MAFRGGRSDLEHFLGGGVDCARSPARSPYVSPAGSIVMSVATPVRAHAIHNSQSHAASPLFVGIQQRCPQWPPALATDIALLHEGKGS